MSFTGTLVGGWGTGDVRTFARVCVRVCVSVPRRLDILGRQDLPQPLRIGLYSSLATPSEQLSRLKTLTRFGDLRLRSDLLGTSPF